MANIVKTKFTGLLRGLLRRFDDGDAAVEPIARPATAARPAESAAPPARPQTPTTPPPTAPAFRIVTPSNPGQIELPLTPIIASLPMELRAKVITAHTDGLMLSVPVEKVVPQLATGTVKITFGEFRQIMPGLFANSGGELDQKPVNLPLADILARMNPAMLARRSGQKTAAVSSEIPSPFDSVGQGLKISLSPAKSAPTPAQPAPRAVTPARPNPLPQPPAPPATPPAPTPPTTPPVAFTPRWTTPAPAPAPVPPRSSMNVPASPAFSAAPATPPIPQPDPSQPVIMAPLAALAEIWPEPLRQEIAQLGLSQAQVALPINLVEPALKRGRVIFSWRYLRSCIKPAAPAASVNDAIELELPLKVLAPLFLTRQNGSGKAQKAVSVSEEIPNLFFGFPEPAAEAPARAPIPFTFTPTALPSPTATPPAEPAPVAAGAPADTSYFTRPDEPQMTDTEFKSKPVPGTDFVSRHSAPADIVARAKDLEGVVGALISLPDGLMVACKIPPDLNADTLAAFLPQIYGRVNQCSRELRMGELNNLSFTVGNVPWKIFRVNAVYFAAFGLAGQSLPAAQLAALAAELDRKNK